MLVFYKHKTRRQIHSYKQRIWNKSDLGICGWKKRLRATPDLNNYLVLPAGTLMPRGGRTRPGWSAR